MRLGLWNGGTLPVEVHSPQCIAGFVRSKVQGRSGQGDTGYDVGLYGECFGGFVENVFGGFVWRWGVQQLALSIGRFCNCLLLGRHARTWRARCLDIHNLQGGLSCVCAIDGFLLYFLLSYAFLTIASLRNTRKVAHVRQSCLTYMAAEPHKPLHPPC